MGILLSAAVAFNMLPAGGFAAYASEGKAGLCEHHTAHTDDCGYTEETPGTPCGHEHTEDCYIEVTECVHEHTPECYPEETEDSVSDNEATPANAEEREPENCPHICDKESGCITEKLDCRHEHDSECGYTESTPGTPCTYVCEICNPQDSGEADEEPETGIIKQEQCSCLTLCTEDQINPDCPICGAEDSGLSDCKGEAAKEDTAQPEDTSICKHHQEHDDACGYQPASEDGEGSPCTYECRVCPIEDLIAALPDTVTEDNAADVRAQLDHILDLYRELNEGEQGQLDLSHVTKLQEALDNANAPVQAAEEINISKNLKNILTAEDGGCQGHTFTGTVQAATIYVESGAHDVTFSGLNITGSANVGIAPGVTMNLTIEGTNTIRAGSNFAGIYVPAGAALVIQGTGALDVSGDGSAGIGGAAFVPDEYYSAGDPNCGIVEIKGGTVTATGGSMCAGIGGGSDADYSPGNGGTVTISGGTVTAAGGSDQIGNYGGAGIGGSAGETTTSRAGSGGSLTISGGHVTLTAGNSTSYGFGQGTGKAPGGMCELTLADASCLTVDSLDPNGKFTIKSAPTADMISVPSDMHYTSADMAAEIKGKVTLAGKVTICNQDFTVDTSGWTLSVTKVSDMEYTATYTHADKGTISKTVTILPCIHNNGAALTHHDRVEADCIHTGILEYWDCSICGKNFSDKDGKTEITDTELPTAAHTLTHHDRVEADCTQTGVKEYWDCSVCGKNFSDKDGQTEITDINIPVTAHTLTHHEGQEATCTAAGSREYWDCSVCGKKFSDQNGQTEIADADIVIAAKPHTLTHHAEVEAGCFTEGNMEYWSCDVCGKLFADAGGAKEVTDIKIPAIGHHDYGEWKSNNDGTHTRRCNKFGCDSTETENCSGGTATYTEEAICTLCGGKYGERLKDAGAPTGEISISTNHWNSFLHTITFGLFFKKTEQVTITAQDNESGVASVSYYISDGGLTEEEVKKLENWTAGNTDKTTFRISPDKSCVVYARITDKQGNVTYISSNGLVFDGTLPSITGVTDGKTYCTPQTVTVTDENLESVTVNGKEITLSDGKFTLGDASGAQTIEAADKAGNIATVTVTVNAGHDYGTDWKSDESSHWHECTCGDKSDTAAHIKDGGTVTKPATEKETGIRTYKCSVCGYVMQEEIIDRLPLSHTHDYGTEWKSDAGNHWYECSCGNKSGLASHIEDGGSVTKAPTETETGIMTFKCRICGYEIRTADIDRLPSSHTHDYSTEWKSDESSHWHECVCGAKSDTATHTEDGGSVTKEPTEKETGVMTYKCSVCGCIMRTEGIDVLPHTHSYGTAWKSDSSSHWHECTCGDKADAATHTEDGGSVTKAPTETEKGIRTYKCSVCGYVMRTEDIAKLPPSSGGGGSSGGNGNNGDSGDHSGGNEDNGGGNSGDNGNNGGGGSTNPGNGNTTPPPSATQPTDTNTSPGNETAPGTGKTPVNPGNGNTVRPGTAPGSGTGIPAQGTKQPFIKGVDGKIGWDVIRAEEEQAQEGSTINVDMNGSVVVPGDIFDSIKGKDITITFDMGSGIIWSVDGKGITTDKAGDIDFSVKTGVKTVPVDIINNVTGENYSIQISLAYEGEFGFTAVLSIGLGRENAGYTASLYYYNENTGELEFICSDEVAEDGTVSLAFTHASDYVIAIDGEQEEESGNAAEPAQSEGNGGTAGNGTEQGSDGIPGDQGTGQTGAAWWIIVVLLLAAVTGAGMFVAIRKKGKDENGRQ